MPKHYCDYCDVFLTHDSASVRKAHNSGRNHLANVRDYYASLGHDKAQSIIDQITSAYETSGGPPPAFGGPPMGFPGGAPPFGRPPFPPPPGMMGGPPFPPGPGMGPPPGMGFPPPGMPPFPPSNGGGMPPFPPQNGNFGPPGPGQGPPGGPNFGGPPPPGQQPGGGPAGGIHPDRLRMMDGGSETNPTELGFTAAKGSWPILWEGRELGGKEEAKEEEEWAQKGFLEGKKKHVGKLGSLLGGYEEEREADRVRGIRRREAEYRDSLPEEDEDTDSDEDVDLPTALVEESPEEMKASFLRLIKEKFIYGLLEGFDYDVVDWDERWDVDNDRDAEERWFDDEEENEAADE
ncbi:hypothetical protein EUX98_g5050 [Antrodiella citrinella]|uniref:U1 small nuclear ribonucleoprotein C n=1 Tax=Antrodiella citrinella TaxID=2447956 RepID=A0A4S4MUY6_9APHY|nr:hypothetical protein EUX98_g5050 [Antrodiella citrinella]